MTTATPIATPVQPANTYIAVMLTPEQDKRSSPYRFPMPKLLGKAKDVAKVEMALDGEFLSAGPNFLTVEAYDQMRQNPFWARCVKKRILAVIDQQPDSRSTGTTADFDSTDAYTLIEGSLDLEWLDKCSKKEDRPEVQTWIAEKTKEIKEAANRE